jgi:WD40 repeat protein
MMPDAGLADAGGPALPPYPPATCPDTTWVPATVPAHATVQSCRAQLALSSAFTTNGSPAPHFFRCGTLGPEIETDVRLSPDGARLATLTGAGTVRLFATDDWRELAQLAPSVGRINAFAFAPDGTRLATLSMEHGELTVWHASDGTPQTTFTGQGTEGGAPLSAAVVAFSRDGRRIASSLGSIVDLGPGTVVPLAAPGSTFEQMAFTMCDAKLYARLSSRTGDSNPSTEVSLYDSQTGKVEPLFSAWSSSFGGSALSQDGRLVAVANGYESGASQSYELSIYRGDTGELVDDRKDWTAGAIQAFTPDDTALMVVNGSTLDQWRIADGAVVTSSFFGTGYRLLGFPSADAITIASPSDAETSSLNKSSSAFGGFRFAATVASWTADGTAGAAIAADGSLFHVWHEPDEADVCAPTAPGPTAAATSFGLSGDGSVLGVGKADGVIDLFDTASGARRGGIETLQGPVARTALSWDGTTAAAQTAAADAPVQIWSAAGNLLGSVTPPADQVSVFSSYPFALSPDARTIAVSQTGDTGALFDVATGAEQQGQLANLWAAGATFSPDSAHVAGWSGALATWRVADAVPDDVLIAPADATPAGPFGLFPIALSNDWSLAAAMNGAALVVWDPRNGAQLSNTTEFTDPYDNTVLGVAGSTVAVNRYWMHTFDADYYVEHLYDVPTGTELRVFDGYDGVRPLLLAPDGAHAYTLEPPDVFTWCR